MATKPNIRFGLIGAGAIARTYVEAFRDLQAGCLQGIADVRPDAAEELAGIANCKAYSSDEELLKSEPVDAVIICTPPASHPDICLRSIEAGKHVLCEKPLAIDSHSARQMIAAAERAGVKLSMASKFRHVDDVIRARAIVNSGILGNVILFENVFTALVDMSTRWNSDRRISGGGVLIDNGTHSVDLTRYFLGPLTELHVVEGKRVQNLPVEETVRMFVRSKDGVMGSIDLSWNMDKELPNYISIYGDQGTVLVGWKESKYRRFASDEWIVFGRGYSKVEAFRTQIVNFIEAIRGDGGLIVTPEDALASVLAIEAAYAAMNERPWTSIVGDDAEVNGFAVDGEPQTPASEQQTS